MHIDIDVTINRFSKRLNKLLKLENVDEIALLLVDTALWARRVFWQTGKTYPPIEEKKFKSKDRKKNSYYLMNVINMLIHSTQVEVDKKEDTLKITDEGGRKITVGYKDFKEALEIFKIPHFERLFAICTKLENKINPIQDNIKLDNIKPEFSWLRKKVDSLRLEQKKHEKLLDGKDFSDSKVLNPPANFKLINKKNETERIIQKPEEKKTHLLPADLNCPSAQSNNENIDILTITEIIQEIEKKSANAEYIYRGEPAHYEKISSSLYRDYPDNDTEGYDMREIQKERLSEAKQHTNENKTDMQILSELQHYGGRTNLIGFTADYRIALFFACDGEPSKDGKVILQRKKPLQDKKQIITPQNPPHRIIAQKSVFVSPPKGYIDTTQEEIVNIPKEQKEEILNRLHKYHGISTQTIYNDLHGFARNQKTHKSAYIEFHKGNTCLFKGDIASTSEEKQAEYNKAVKHYDEAIKLSPDLPPECKNLVIVHKGTHNAAIGLYLRIYNNRGIVHCKKGDYEKAIDDFNKTGEYQTGGDFYKTMGDFYCGIAYGRTNHDQVASCHKRARDGLSLFFQLHKREPIEKELKQFKEIENDLRTELKFAKEQGDDLLFVYIRGTIIYMQKVIAALPADLDS